MPQRIARVNNLRFHFPAIIACTALLVGSLVLPAPRAAFAQSISDEQSRPAAASSANTNKDEPATTVSVQVNVVNVLATVRDKKGNVVPDLTKDDFTLNEDGRPQSIGYFTKET